MINTDIEHRTSPGASEQEITQQHYRALPVIFLTFGGKAH